MHYLLMAAFLWGTSFIAGKVAYTSLDPALTVAARLVLASIVLLPLTWKFFRSYYSNGVKDTVITKKMWLWLVFLGLLTYPLTFMLQFLGLEITSAASATTILGIEPIMAAIVGVMFFKQSASWQMIALGVVAFIGVGLLVGVSGLENVSIVGCLYVFASTVVVAFWLRLSKRILDVIEPSYYTALTIQLGTLAGLPFMLLLVKDWDIEITLQGFLAVLYLGVGCSFCAGWLWNKGLQSNAANQSSVFFALEPVFGVLFAVVLLGEHLNGISIIGIVLVLCAAFIAAVMPQDETA